MISDDADPDYTEQLTRIVNTVPIPFGGGMLLDMFGRLPVKEQDEVIEYIRRRIADRQQP